MFKYYDSTNTLQTHTFDSRLSKGLYVPDYKYSLVPPEAFYNLADGSTQTDYRGFQRFMLLDIAPLTANEDFIRAFVQADTKFIRYLDIDGVHYRETEIIYAEIVFEDEWYNDFYKTMHFILELVENRIRHAWLPPYPTGDDLTYIIKKVKVERPASDPELFTSGVGKLAINYGSVPPPVMNLGTTLVAISFTKYQTAGISQVGDITQNVSDTDEVDVHVGYDEFGSPASDGFFYADFTFLLQTKV